MAHRQLRRQRSPTNSLDVLDGCSLRALGRKILRSPSGRYASALQANKAVHPQRSAGVPAVDGPRWAIDTQLKLLKTANVFSHQAGPASPCSPPRAPQIGEEPFFWFIGDLRG